MVYPITTMGDSTPVANVMANANAIPIILGSKAALMAQIPVIGRNFDREKYAQVKKRIQGNIGDIQETGDAFLVGDSGPMDTLLAKRVIRAQEEILLSFLKPDFLAEYGDEYFEIGLGHRKMLQNLDVIIGSPTEAEVEERAETIFEDMVRRTQMNESFSAFLGRLKLQAAKFITDGDYRAKRVAKQFKKSVREMDGNFLMFAEATNTVTDVMGKLDWQAGILDKKGYHKRSGTERSVRAVQDQNRVEDSIVALTEQISLVGAHLDGFRQEFAQEQKRQNERNDARFCELERKVAHFSGSGFSQNCAPFPNAGQMVAHHVSQPWPQSAPPATEKQKKTPGWQGKVTRQKMPCFECGSMRHVEADCPGPCKASCFLCGEQGHMATSRRFHGVKDQKKVAEPKNE